MTTTDWNNITDYMDTVGTTPKTISFNKTQNFVKVTTRGNASITYTIGTKSGTLTSGQNISVSEKITSFTVTATSGVQTIEIYATEDGTEKTEDNGLDPIAALASKANQSDLNTTNANVATNATAISNIGNGSPKGTYATLSALQTAFPTGTTGIYVVTADGKWYYWNGSAWTAGGTYQSTGLSTGSVTPSTTSFSITTTGVNKFNKNDANVILGYYLNGTGAQVANASLFISGFIPVNPGDVVRMHYDGYTSGNMGSFYDSNKVFVSNETVSNPANPSVVSFTVPSGVSYFRFNGVQSVINTLMFTLNTAYPQTYAAYLESYQLDNTFNFLNHTNEITGMLKTPATGINKFNKTDTNVVLGSYLNGSGVQTANAPLFISGYIPVVQGNTINVDYHGYTSGNMGSYYDINLAFISNAQVASPINNTVVTFTVPSNPSIAYFRMNGVQANINTTMLTVNDPYPTIYQAYTTFNALDSSWDLSDAQRTTVKKLNNVSRYGKKWIVFGDSLTDNTNAYASKRYFDYVSNDLNLNVTNMGVSGTGYMRTQGSNTAFYQRISSADATADLLTIFGSGNDCNLTALGVSGFGSATDTGTASVAGCINTTFDNFYSLMPLKRLAVITPTPWAGYDLNIPNNNMEQFTDLLVQICKNRGIPCLDLYHSSGLRPSLAAFNALYYENSVTGNTHPNDSGHQYIYPAIREFIKSLI